MYNEFFGLRESPFNLTPDPRFFFLSRRHQEALSSLVYGIRERKGFIVLTGEIGAGKTTLCRTFLEEIETDTCNVALILNSYLNDLELLQAINDEFGIDSSATSKKTLIDHLNRFLLEEADKGKTNILIIDEAQNLAPAVLEQIRMLSNLETANHKLIQIVLMGQPELGEILARPELEQLAQRIMVRCHIGPLDKPEIHHYILHRLKVAGARVNLGLAPAALNRIYHFTRGIPRRINILCDRTLLAAYVAGQYNIDSKLIAIAEKELRHLSSGRRIGKARSFRPGRSFLIALLALVVLIGATGGSLWVAWKFDWSRSIAPAAATADASEARDGEADFAAVATPPTRVLPGIADLPSTVTLEQSWAYDENAIVRVEDPDFARMAALLTVGRLWRFQVPLDNFPSYDKPTILSINLPSIFSGPQVNLRSFDYPVALEKAIELDLPLVVDLHDPSGRLSPSVVLTGVRGEVATLADPRLGQVRVALAEIAPLVQGITVFYVDPDQLTLLTRDEESDAVEALRRFLMEQGTWSGQATRSFNRDMARSIQQFQARIGLAQNGHIDGPTAAAIAARRQAFRPRLLQNPAGSGN